MLWVEQRARKSGRDTGCNGREISEDPCFNKEKKQSQEGEALLKCITVKR